MTFRHVVLGVMILVLSQTIGCDRGGGGVMPRSDVIIMAMHVACPAEFTDERDICKEFWRAMDPLIEDGSYLRDGDVPVLGAMQCLRDIHSQEDGSLGSVSCRMVFR